MENLETKIKVIIKKVRRMLKYSEYSSLVKQRASIELSEDKNGNLKLDNISFNGWDSIIVCDTSIFVVPERGENVVLAKFKSLDAFIDQIDDD